LRRIHQTAAIPGKQNLGGFHRFRAPDEAEDLDAASRKLNSLSRQNDGAERSRMRRLIGLASLAVFLGIAGANAEHTHYRHTSHHEIGSDKNGGTWYYAPRYNQDATERRLFGPEVNGG
jgi:hypothetical protein